MKNRLKAMTWNLQKEDAEELFLKINCFLFTANDAEDWLQKLQTEAGKSDTLPVGK